MRRPVPILLTSVVLLLGLVVSMQNRSAWTKKLDFALAAVVKRGVTEDVRTMIRVRAGAGDRLRARLAQQGIQSTPLTTPDLLVAVLSTDLLRPVALDSDVVRISSDAVVKGLGSKLGLNTLLGTQGLLKTSGSSTVLSTRYTGHNVGVAVIDSGVTAGNGDLSAVTFYDVTNKMKQGGNYDDYGHGTHVSGLVASNGSFSNYQYQGVASSAQLIEMKVLDKNGNGYTSDVINAINYVVANRSRLHLGVINLSLGHPIYEPAASDPLVQAVEDAVANGIVVVVSAGNFGGDPVTHEVGYAGITSPANAPGAITVGAIETLQTVQRGDDTIPWYSSRGPTWFDAYQKPDVVAPGSHLVSDVSTISTIYKTYPRGVTMVNGKPFITMSGTSMAAPVVSGIVAAMLDANRTVHPGAPLTPNAVKAILQYTAIPVGGYDELTQGAGAVNAVGAIALAEAIDPGAPPGSGWLTRTITPSTVIGGEPLAWGQRVVWGDRVIWGSQMLTNDPAWALRVVWGDRVIWGNRVVWGTSTVWDGNQMTWGNRVVWGNGLIGQSTTSGTQWGGLDPSTGATRVVWGNLTDLRIAPTALSWGNLERANMDIK